jgi:glutamate--cysteine ligase
MDAITKLFQGPTRQKRPYQVGIEIERLGMWTDGTALHYGDQAHAGQTRWGAEKLLNTLAAQKGWEPVLSSLQRPIGLKSPHGKVSLEPGSQLELSSDPHPNLNSLIADVAVFESAVSQITKPWGLHWLGLGHNPCNSVEDIDLIPAPRYQFMTNYLGRKGKLATRMMKLTTSVQVNLDYGSETEGMEMLRASLLLAPLSYAMFANSPFADGKLTPYLSYRAEIWRQTDPERTGLLDEVFCDGFGFEEYAKLVYTRPLMFAQDTRGEFVPAEGLSLADIEQGKLPGVEVDDNNRMNSVREIFTEARLKPGYIEIRSIDGQRADYRYATTAFWMGALYSADARALVMKTLGKLTNAQRAALLEQVLKQGLSAKAEGIDVGGLANEVVDLAKGGLQARGFNEEHFLCPLSENVRARLNPAQILIRNYEGSWNKSLSKVIEYCGGV